MPYTRNNERRLRLLIILGDGKLHKARELADVQDVSLRTIWRDIRILRRDGYPILSGPGAGYMLKKAGRLKLEGILNERSSESGELAWSERAYARSGR